MRRSSALPKCSPAASRALHARRYACQPAIRCHARRPDHNPQPVPVPGAWNLAIGALQRLGQAALGVAVGTALLLSPPATADQLLTFPVSPKPEVFSVQRTLVEAWTICTEAFVDPDFNGVDWVSELSGALNTAAEASTPEEAQRQIVGLLAKLGDPFTRWVSPQEYQDFRVGSDGELQGVGLLIASDPSSGRLVVLAPISGSPAERAGIQPGDQVLSVDGTSTEGWDNENLAKHLRGSEGSAVWVEVGRPRAEPEQIPGMAGNRFEDVDMERKRFRLLRAKLEFSPIFAAPMHYDGHTFGYVRLVNFSMKAAGEMQKAVAQLQRDGAEGFILDLRNNPGGLVRASMDIAGLWMDGVDHPTIFNIEDREGAESSIARVVLEDGLAATDQPLVVLVNKQSASASEILAAALHDNHRATVLGEPTFGKGKIQSVFELGDGSALFVTVAKYKTPAGLEIDQVGVKPDEACSPDPDGPGAIPGIPVGPGASLRVIEELGMDDCVLSAQSLLESQMDSYWKGTDVRLPAVATAPIVRFNGL